MTKDIQGVSEAHEDKWEGAEEWMPLAWELCANECGEEACTELVWEGGPIPEPWGDRWLKYEDQAKEMIAMVRASLAAAQAPAPAPEPAPWVPYLTDRADGVAGHYAIARWNPAGYREVWNLRNHRWASASDDVLCLEEADSLLRQIVIPTVKPVPVAQAFTEGHCAEKRKPGGCQLHNLHCGYPACDRKAAVQAPAPVAEERDRLRAAQAAAVMPLIGPLLDAWEQADREVMAADEPELWRWLKAINTAMETAGEAEL